MTEVESLFFWPLKDSWKEGRENYRWKDMTNCKPKSEADSIK